MIKVSDIFKSWTGDFTQYAPYPASCERAQWAAADKTMTDEILQEAQKRVRGYKVPPLPASLYMDLCSTGTRQRFEDVYFERRISLNLFVLAECIEHKGAYITSIVDIIFALCEETGWQLPAHNNYVRNEQQLPLPKANEPVLDLFACETGCQLALIQYLLKEELDAISPIIRERITEELKKRIFTPYIKRTFWWMGYKGEKTNNWTVWCTQNVLIAAFTPGVSGDVTDKALAQKMRGRIVRRAAYSIDRFLAGYGDDGCCDEGAQYYRHAALCLYSALDVLSKVSAGCCEGVFGERKIKNIAEYILHVHAAGKYYINFADCAAVAGPAGVREYLFGKRCASGALKAFASSDWAKTVSSKSIHTYTSTDDSLNLLYLLQELFSSNELLSYNANDKHKVPIQADIAYKSVGLFISRDDTYCLAVKAGGNGDSHNHNDTGSFTLYKNGAPFIIDAGVETYSKKTFSPERYEIWTMQSLYHNVTNFDSYMQHEGAQYKATHVIYKVEGSTTSVSMDLAGAYPAECGVRRYWRQVSHKKGLNITVRDFVDGSFKKAYFTLMTEALPVLSKAESDKAVQIYVGNAGSVYAESENNVSATVEEIPVEDARLRMSWGKTLYRVRIEYKGSIIAKLV